MVQFLLEHQGSAPLASIWLGGAYGRGEGAVFRQGPQGKDERPWFEYDVYLIPHQETSADNYSRWADTLSQNLSQSVRLNSPGDVQAITCLEPRLLWYDLCLGHQVIWGDADLIPQLRGDGTLSLQVAQNLLLYWGGRLLGLADTPDRPDSKTHPEALNTFYRCAAGLGDAWLIATGLYHVSSQERALRFHSWQREHGPDWSRELGYLYQEALQYQLLPSDFSAVHQQLSSRIPELRRLFVTVYLAIFSQEVRSQLDLQQFEDLFLERRDNPVPTAWQLRHLVSNLRQYRGRHFHSGWYSRPLLHRLYFLLPFLLSDSLPAQTALHRALPDLSPEADLTEVQAAFMDIWQLVEPQLI